jgi:hypothetical protein
MIDEGNVEDDKRDETGTERKRIDNNFGKYMAKGCPSHAGSGNHQRHFAVPRYFDCQQIQAI